MKKAGKEKLSTQWLKPSTIFWALLALLAFWGTFASFHPAAPPPLPRNQTFENVAAVQDDSGRVTEYAALVGKEWYTIDRDTYQAWQLQGGGIMRTNALKTPHSDVSITNFWKGMLCLGLLAIALLHLSPLFLPHFRRSDDALFMRRAERFSQATRGIVAAFMIMSVVWLVIGPLAARTWTAYQTRNNPRVTATVLAQVDQESHLSSPRFRLVNHYVLLAYLDGHHMTQVWQSVGVGTDSVISTGTKVSVVPLTDTDRVVRLIPPRNRLIVLDWFTDGLLMALFMVVVLFWPFLAWYRQSSSDQKREMITGSLPLFPMTSMAFIMSMVVLCTASVLQYNTSENSGRTNMNALVTYKTAQAALRKPSKVPPAASEPGTQYTTFERLVTYFCHPMLSDSNGAIRKEMSQNKEALGQLQKQLVQSTTPEGQDLKLFADHVAEFYHYMLTGESVIDHIQEFQVYLSAETVELGHHYYRGKIPPILRQHAEDYEVLWSKDSDAANAHKDNQMRWIMAERLKSKSSIEKAKNPLETLFDTEDRSNGIYDDSQIHVKGKTITTPGYKFTFTSAKTQGQGVVVYFTMTNLTQNLYFRTDPTKLLGVGFTSTTDQLSSALSTSTDGDGLWGEDQQRVQNLRYMLKPRATAELAAYVTDWDSQMPLYFMVGGGDFAPVVGTIKLR
ncbi:MAG: hypothetical protein ABF743_11730 [Schleiferilactobacillus perolens]|uniref:hypothetical protein n=1 Tax=Schleiferilactobacillus perolens TaxID=100468 RepID=UPI0039E8F9D7